MSKTVLLADDSVTIRKVVELTFMEEDYALVPLGSGEEALEQLEGVNPDLVIADVNMPGVSGYEVCRRAKELRPERPVLLLVGTFEPFDATELEGSGAETHLKKPFDSQELLQTVRDLLAGGEAAAAVPIPDEAAGEEEAAAAEAAAAEGPQAAVGEPEFEAAVPIDPIPAAEAAVTSESATGPEEAAEPVAAAADNGGGELSDEAVDRIARRVAELLGPDAVREVAWEVVPDLAEVVIKERLRELESQVE